MCSISVVRVCEARPLNILFLYNQSNPVIRKNYVTVLWLYGRCREIICSDLNLKGRVLDVEARCRSGEMSVGNPHFLEVCLCCKYI